MKADHTEENVDPGSERTYIMAEEPSESSGEQEREGLKSLIGSNPNIEEHGMASNLPQQIGFGNDCGKQQLTSDKDFEPLHNCISNPPRSLLN